MCHNPEIELLPSTEAMLLSGVKKSMPSFFADNPIFYILTGRISQKKCSQTDKLEL